MAIQFKDYRSVYRPTGGPEIAQYLREKYETNKAELDLLEKTFAAIPTRPGDVHLKDLAKEKIDGKLNGIINTGRYEMAGMAITESKNIIATDPGLLAAQSSFTNRQKDVEFMEKSAQEGKEFIDWGEEDWLTGVSYIETEDGEIKQKIYQPQATRMYDYNAEQMKMLKTIKADWSGISADKSMQIAETLLMNYLSPDNRIGTQQYQYLGLKTSIKDLKDKDKEGEEGYGSAEDEKHEAIVNHIRKQFQNITAQYIHVKKSETTQNKTTTIDNDYSTALFDPTKHVKTMKIVQGVNNSNGISHYAQLNSKKFDFGKTQNPEDKMFAMKLLENYERSALLNSEDFANGKITNEEIDKYMYMKYGWVQNSQFAEVASIIDYLTQDLGTISRITGGKFGKLQDKNLGETAVDATIWGMTSHVSKKVIEHVVGKKFKMLSKLGLVVTGSKAMYDIAVNQLFNNYNNVRDGWTGDNFDSQAEMLNYILSDVAWLNTKTNTQYEYDSAWPTVLGNAEALLDFRVNGKGDLMDDIIDDYNGTAFESQRFTSTDPTAISNANKLLATWADWNWEIPGISGVEVKDMIMDNLSKEQQKDGVNIYPTFNSIIAPDIKNNIGLSLELDFNGTSVLVNSKAKPYRTNTGLVVGGNEMEAELVTTLGLGHYVVEDNTRTIVWDWVENGSTPYGEKVNYITPALVVQAMTEAYQTTPFTIDGQEVTLTRDQAMRESTDYIFNIFKSSYPDVVQHYEQEVWNSLIANGTIETNDNGQVIGSKISDAQREQMVQNLVMLYMQDRKHFKGNTSWYNSRLQ